MQIGTLFYIFLAFIAALLIVYFQYFYKENKQASTWVLAILRFVAVFSILLLLINPKIEKKQYDISKPKLLVAVDNSSSIAFAKQDSLVHNLLGHIKSNRELNDKFDISYFSFGNNLKNEETFSFQETQTNIYKALHDLNALDHRETSPILLLSDGNQTYGNDYQYYFSENPIYPIVIGDTVKFSDLEIGQINVNKYAHLDNKFPVEIYVNYSGQASIQTVLSVEKNDRTLFKQEVKFSKNKKSDRLSFNLPASAVGKQLYSVKLSPFQKEVNTLNNMKNFGIEVLDQQRNIALVYDILHPDIGMIKRVIEGNKGRKVNLIGVDQINPKLTDKDVFILYQPNRKFEEIIRSIRSDRKNMFIITGKNTDWDFLNNAQNDFKKTNNAAVEKYDADYQENFDKFYSEDIGFSNFPPLEDVFGTITFEVPFQSLLLQNVQGLSTEQPLLAVFATENGRQVILFGENIWKWRAWSYASERTFEKFDPFFNSLIQFLTITKKDSPITLNYKSFYYANDLIKITAKTYDDNLDFDANAQLEFSLQGESKPRPLVLNDGVYTLQLVDLKSGVYNFTVKNTKNGAQNHGSFTIAEYAVEHEIKTTNSSGLEALAIQSNGKSYYPDQKDDLFDLLIDSQDFKKIQKESKKMMSFIDWKWFLSLIILSLSLEWFIRKYRGLV